MLGGTKAVHCLSLCSFTQRCFIHIDFTMAVLCKTRFDFRVFKGYCSLQCAAADFCALHCSRLPSHFREQIGYVMEIGDFLLPLATTSLGVDLAGSVLSCAAVAAREPQLPSKPGAPGSVAEWPGGNASPKCSVTAGWQPQQGTVAFKQPRLPPHRLRLHQGIFSVP